MPHSGQPSLVWLMNEEHGSLVELNRLLGHERVQAFDHCNGQVVVEVVVVQHFGRLVQQVVQVVGAFDAAQNGRAAIERGKLLKWRQLVTLCTNSPPKRESSMSLTLRCRRPGSAAQNSICLTVESKGTSMFFIKCSRKLLLSSFV